VSPCLERLYVGIGDAGVPVDEAVLEKWHGAGASLPDDLCYEGLLLVRGEFAPV